MYVLEIHGLIISNKSCVFLIHIRVGNTLTTEGSFFYEIKVSEDFSVGTF